MNERCPRCGHEQSEFRRYADGKGGIRLCYACAFEWPATENGGDHLLTAATHLLKALDDPDLSDYDQEWIALAWARTTRAAKRIGAKR